ncbi:uncharacterized protein FFFS_15812 [Fusarium fujikuroi]|nr:uncharacterized protein FFFS_15812 [Fusarium fujikuroi]
MAQQGTAGRAASVLKLQPEVPSDSATQRPLELQFENPVGSLHSPQQIEEYELA